jgi:hypothetical protein
MHASEKFRFLGCDIGIYSKHKKQVVLIKPGPTDEKQKVKEIWTKNRDNLPRVIIRLLNPLLRG